MKQLNSINAACTACQLHETASDRAVCLKGKGVDQRRKLLIYTDVPDFFADRAGRAYTGEVYRILSWMLRRMSVDLDQVAFDYTLRCYPARSLPTTKAYRAECIMACAQYRFATVAKVRPKAIVCLGNVSLEAFTGKTKIGEYEGRRIWAWEPVVRDYTDGVWVGYSIAYLQQYPGDAPSVFRTIWRAAEEAGLKPTIDKEVKPYTWNTF